MNLQSSYRICGGALVWGAILFALHAVARSVLTAGVDPLIFAQGTFWLPVNTLGALGSILVLLGLPAVFIREVQKGSHSAFAAIVLIAVAWMLLGVFLTLYGALILPWLARRAPHLIDTSAALPASLVAAFLAALLLWIVGASLLAVSYLRGREQPRWVGTVLLLSGPWNLLADLVIAPSGPADNLLVNLLSNLGPLLLLIGLAYIGLEAWTGRTDNSVIDRRGHSPERQ
jgi:hypothetical protein